MIRYRPFELHTHTVHSDGDFTPAALVQAAHDFGCAGIALTDHNTDAGMQEIYEAARDSLLPVIPGIEWTTYYGHMLVIGCQGFVGIPICNFFVRKYCNGIIAGTIQMGETVEVQEESKKRRLLDFKWMAGDNTIIAKMAIVGWLGYLVSFACAGIPVLSNLTNANIMYLVMGIIFCVLGFLPANAHVKAHMNGFLLLAVLSVVPGSLATLSLEDLLRMIFPLVGTLIVGAAFVCLFGAIAGKVLHVHWTFAIAICCTIGYPGTQIIVDEVVRSLHCDEPTRVKIYEHVLPQILVSGFTSVTVASVFFAGLICPLIF